jgi:hypothetical protein
MVKSLPAFIHDSVTNTKPKTSWEKLWKKMNILGKSVFLNKWLSRIELRAYFP